MTPETRKKLQEVANRVPRNTNGQWKPEKTKKAKTPAATPANEPPHKAPDAIDVYYDAGAKSFWAKNGAGEWQEVSKENLGLILRASWYSTSLKLTNSLTILESKLLEIIQHNCVHFAGKIAGWKPGLAAICGENVLVTRGPRIVAPKRGPFPLIKRFVAELLRDQGLYFYAWMKSAYNALREGAPFAPGQLLAIAGPVGSGKSLMQMLVTEMLGGRMSKPYRYLSGQTPFNGDMIASEHLCIEDEFAKTDIRTRRFFGAALKSLLVNKSQSAHPKGRPAFTTEPFWRVTMTLNDEPEALMILPPLDGDLADKVTLLQASEASKPYPSKELPTMAAYWAALKAEIPAYLAALARWEIPKEIRDIRYGVVAFHNAELLRKLTSLSPEVKLWQLILQCGLLDNAMMGWSGSSIDLEKELIERDRTGQLKDLLYYPTACGYYLARLAKSMPDNVEREELRANQLIFHLARNAKTTLGI